MGNLPDHNNNNNNNRKQTNNTTKGTKKKLLSPKGLLCVYDCHCRLAVIFFNDVSFMHSRRTACPAPAPQAFCQMGHIPQAQINKAAFKGSVGSL